MTSVEGLMVLHGEKEQSQRAEQINAAQWRLQTLRQHVMTCMRQGDGCEQSKPLFGTSQGWTCPCGKYRETGREVV